MFVTRRLVPGLVLAAALAACTSDIDPETAGRPIGDFSLDRVVVIVDDPQKGGFSRNMGDAEIKAAVEQAVTTRFSRFQGDAQYSIGIKVVGYALAQPGIPVLVAPRSALFMNVNLYDDVPQRLNAEPKRLTVFEDAGGDTVIGSGYTQSGSEQLVELAENAAVEIEKWIRENPHLLAGPEPQPEG